MLEGKLNVPYGRWAKRFRKYTKTACSSLSPRPPSSVRNWVVRPPGTQGLDALQLIIHLVLGIFRPRPSSVRTGRTTIVCRSLRAKG